MAKKTKKERDLARTERAAALRAQHERAERMRRLGVGAAVVVAIALVAAALVWATRDRSGDVTVNTKIAASVGDHSLLVGPDDAPHKVVVWEDFLCPFCREFESSSRTALHQAAEKGTVQIEYRPFQLLGDDYSEHTLAAFAYVLQNATPQEALAFHDLLYENQPYETGPKPSESRIAGWAAKVGVSKDAVEKAIKGGESAWHEAAGKAATDAGVRGTPTVTIDGKPLTGNSISQMVANLEAAIGE